MSGALSIVAALALAHQCAATVAPETVVSIAKTESGLNPLAIHDNTTGLSYQPGSAKEAIALASSLIAQRHSVDLGLMQINSTNLVVLNLAITHAFDPCHSMAAGAQFLSGVFQRALRTALSTYNTGDPQRGIDNGYVARVETAATTLPAITLPTILPVTPAAAPEAPAAPPGTPTGAAWDVFAQSGGAQFVFTSNGATANAR
jgi:type IV secretion system protein VirB1